MSGQAVNAFVAIKDGNETGDPLRKELVLQVRKSIGPFAAPKAVFIVPDLPKTRSGKIMRRILRKVLAGEEDSLGDISTVCCWALDPSLSLYLCRKKFRYRLTLISSLIPAWSRRLLRLSISHGRLDVHAFLDSRICIVFKLVE